MIRKPFRLRHFQLWEEPKADPKFETLKTFYRSLARDKIWSLDQKVSKLKVCQSFEIRLILTFAQNFLSLKKKIQVSFRAQVIRGSVAYDLGDYSPRGSLCFGTSESLQRL
jgi:hypothetical protein